MKKAVFAIAVLVLLAACSSSPSSSEEDSFTDRLQHKTAKVLEKTALFFQETLESLEPGISSRGAAVQERAEEFLEEFPEIAESKIEEGKIFIRNALDQEKLEE